MTRINHKKSARTNNPHLVIFIGALLFVLAIVGIGISLDTANAGNNNQTGRVKVSTGLYKMCDEENLVYMFSHGIAVSPNDPQCN